MASQADIEALKGRPFFFCGIGGSGMLPLAQIVRQMGHEVAGSDRARDQGRLKEKFAALEAQGFRLFAQDGSGLSDPQQVLIASAAIEDSVPEVARAKELGCERMTRAQLLGALFNAAPRSVGIAGTSGKSTVTAMTGWILANRGRDPTIMNGAVMKNFVSTENPIASARLGQGELFVSEVDESDGSIALYRPNVGVLLNVSLDHKSMEELRKLFGDFLKKSHYRVVNADDPECLALAKGLDNLCSFALANHEADIGIDPSSVIEEDFATRAQLIDRRDGRSHTLKVPMGGRHNLSNALAAIAAANMAGVPIAESVSAMAEFAGLARRFDLVGSTKDGISVIDDFGHNPEKCAATLRTLKAGLRKTNDANAKGAKSKKGRVIAFFQPHGFGPLRQMGHALAQSFARELDSDDIAVLCDPVYFGGTVDRSVGSEEIVRQIEEAGGTALYFSTREACGEAIIAMAQPGDRIAVMGARDDSLSAFARSLYAAISRRPR